jgi:hypothetical protein
VATIAIHHLVFGKLVTALDGPISRYAIQQATSASRGLDQRAWPVLSANALIDPVELKPESVLESVRQPGALIVRCMEIPTYQGRAVLGCRVRYRPEAGEGRPGRVCSQSRTLIVDERTWHQYAPAIISSSFRNLTAPPDLDSESENHRFARDPVPLDPGFIADRTADQIPDAVWSVILDFADKGYVRIGSESCEDEPTFLDALALVNDLWKTLFGYCLMFGITSGYAEEDDRFLAQYFPGTRRSRSNEAAIGEAHRYAGAMGNWSTLKKALQGRLARPMRGTGALKAPPASTLQGHASLVADLVTDAKVMKDQPAFLATSELDSVPTAPGLQAVSAADGTAVGRQSWEDSVSWASGVLETSLRQLTVGHDIGPAETIDDALMVLASHLSPMSFQRVLAEVVKAVTQVELTKRDRLEDMHRALIVARAVLAAVAGTSRADAVRPRSHSVL